MPLKGSMGVSATDPGDVSTPKKLPEVQTESEHTPRSKVRTAFADKAAWVLVDMMDKTQAIIIAMADCFMLNSL
jgi:hypothetical protein